MTDDRSKRLQKIIEKRNAARTTTEANDRKRAEQEHRADEARSKLADKWRSFYSKIQNLISDTNDDLAQTGLNIRLQSQNKSVTADFSISIYKDRNPTNLTIKCTVDTVGNVRMLTGRTVDVQQEFAFTDEGALKKIDDAILVLLEKATGEQNG